MLSDRRPILLTNARIIDPSRNLDFPGDLLIADGVIREAKQGIGAAGVPEGTEIVDCKGKVVAPGLTDMRLVGLTGGRYHAASVTCPESLSVLQRAKEEGYAVTASASINHLTLNEVDVGSYRTFCKLTPPLRAEQDRAALVAAVASGLVDVVMSDHDPQDVETKRLPFAEAEPGAIGIETMLVAGLRLVHNGEIELAALLKALSTRPAELLDLPGG